MDEFLSKGAGMLVFGCPVSECTREELMALVLFFANREINAMDRQVKEMRFILQGQPNP